MPSKSTEAAGPGVERPARFAAPLQSVSAPRSFCSASGSHTPAQRGARIGRRRSAPMRWPGSVLNRGRPPRRWRSLALATRQDPTWAEPVFARVKLLERSGHIAEARDQALRAHQLAPHDPDILLKALRLDAVMVRPQQAETLAREGVARMPERAETHLLLGKALAAGTAERAEEAVRELQEARRLDPALTATASLALGKLYAGRGQEARAATALEAAARALDAQIDPTPVPVTELGRINQWLLDRRETAFTLSQVYLRLRRLPASQAQALLTTRSSAAADRLKSLVARATMTPPDRAARAEIAALCRKGVGSMP